MQITNDVYLKALKKQPINRTPVWIMRQAGRYLPEYREVRQNLGSFMDLCRSTEFATEVTLQPLRRFNLDAAILFSDILTIPDAMGLGLNFIPKQGPVFDICANNAAVIDRLPNIDPNVELQYVMNAVSSIKKELKGSVPLIGFSGSPWTLACYMVDGSNKYKFAKAKTMMFKEPLLLKALLSKLQTAVADYLCAQVEAGADALMLFDSWGGLLSYNDYQEFSLHYVTNIISQVKAAHPNIPITLYTKGGGCWLDLMAASGCDGLGLDWTVDLGAARKLVGDKVVLQGNLDPMTLYGTKDAIRNKVQQALASFGSGAGHIFNLGHGILPDIDPDNVKCMVDAVAEYSAKYHT